MAMSDETREAELQRNLKKAEKALNTWFRVEKKKWSPMNEHAKRLKELFLKRDLTERKLALMTFQDQKRAAEKKQGRMDDRVARARMMSGEKKTRVAAQGTSRLPNKSANVPNGRPVRRPSTPIRPKTPPVAFSDNLRPPMTPQARKSTRSNIRLNVAPTQASLPIVEPIVRPIVEPIVEPIVRPIVEPIVKPIVEPRSHMREVHKVNSKNTKKNRPETPDYPVVETVGMGQWDNGSRGGLWGTWGNTGGMRGVGGGGQDGASSQSVQRLPAKPVQRVPVYDSEGIDWDAAIQDMNDLRSEEISNALLPKPRRPSVPRRRLREEERVLEYGGTLFDSENNNDWGDKSPNHRPTASTSPRANNVFKSGAEQTNYSAHLSNIPLGRIPSKRRRITPEIVPPTTPITPIAPIAPIAPLPTIPAMRKRAPFQNIAPTRIPNSIAAARIPTMRQRARFSGYPTNHLLEIQAAQIPSRRKRLPSNNVHQTNWEPRDLKDVSVPIYAPKIPSKRNRRNAPDELSQITEAQLPNRRSRRGEEVHDRNRHNKQVGFSPEELPPTQIHIPSKRLRAKSPKKVRFSLEEPDTNNELPPTEIQIPSKRERLQSNNHPSKPKGSWQPTDNELPPTQIRIPSKRNRLGPGNQLNAYRLSRQLQDNELPPTQLQLPTKRIRFQEDSPAFQRQKKRGDSQATSSQTIKGYQTNRGSQTKNKIPRRADPIATQTNMETLRKGRTISVQTNEWLRDSKTYGKNPWHFPAWRVPSWRFPSWRFPSWHFPSWPSPSTKARAGTTEASVGKSRKDERDEKDGKDVKDSKDEKDGKAGKDGKDRKDGKGGKSGKDGKDGRDGQPGHPWWRSLFTSVDGPTKGPRKRTESTTTTTGSEGPAEGRGGSVGTIKGNGSSGPEAKRTQDKAETPQTTSYSEKSSDGSGWVPFSADNKRSIRYRHTTGASSHYSPKVTEVGSQRVGSQNRHSQSLWTPFSPINKRSLRYGQVEDQAQAGSNRKILAANPAPLPYRNLTRTTQSSFSDPTRAYEQASRKASLVPPELRSVRDIQARQDWKMIEQVANKERSLIPHKRAALAELDALLLKIT